MESTWNMMNFLKSAVNAVLDAAKLSYVYDNAILKRFIFKFQEIHHIPGTFHCNVNKDFSIMIVLEGPLRLTFGGTFNNKQSLYSHEGSIQTSFFILSFLLNTNEY